MKPAQQTLSQMTQASFLLSCDESKQKLRLLSDPQGLAFSCFSEAQMLPTLQEYLALKIITMLNKASFIEQKL